MEWPFQRMALLFGILLGGGMIVFWVGEQRFSSQEREKAVERCRTTPDVDRCLAGIDSLHDECFRKTVRGGGRYSRRYIDTREYDFCVRNGVEEMRKQRAVWHAQEFKNVTPPDPSKLR